MELNIIQNKIFEVRGQRVMLDYDLAKLYEVETKVLNQGVKRNWEKFPLDFMFQLNEKEWQCLRSQFVTLDIGRGRYSKYLPYVFTEHGVAMLASVLKSGKAVKMNIAIIRAFIALRSFALTYKEIEQKLLEMQDKYDGQFADVYEALKQLIDKKKEKQEWQTRERIGFK